MDYVVLKCVGEGSKLRVKMMSSAPFAKGANCQFPRAVREEGAWFVVRADRVTMRGNFYTAMKADTIVLRTKDEAEVKRFVGQLDTTKVKIATIFGDADDPECVVCLSSKKDSVFAPCGHYVACSACARQCKSCPMCRGGIDAIVLRDQVE